MANKDPGGLLPDGTISFMEEIERIEMVEFGMEEDAEEVEKIQHDIFPYMSELAISDKREILEIGKKDMLCFLAERDNKFVHYTLIYTNIFNSPLMQTPFDKSSLSSQHVYLSSAYTVDSERGSWIHLQALSYIIEYLKTPLTQKEILSLSKKLGLSPSEFVRKNESDFKENNLSQFLEDNNAMAKAIEKYPKIMERPIAVRGDKAIMGRPPENILTLLGRRESP